ncbi:glycerol-3-phosphate dehydrogenase [Legionella anisa]|uniref:Glycerol-3-phosphate dehydrogenase n=2 Tax=Legionella anisa TaxID=28082 RepID=A0AAX0WTQ9_9GAMM|nr:glycerol-3-phosphate dehydrogenase [Legionella anisa]AWN74444.1 glycerol-3-phosphate dehydrogenase [Legionella anisa]KTC71869.1 glycerol-3-phosphate dehydrogenase [Legionella anisa]MBN5935401.1 glycerol-3-phosphate dehydrogenase [Legionella anisa]MCW8425454.1 glycerol-3-phosphate dehydrogenase [Legionella anisa]MCW8449115.1 glycerol-3-phosphate dehydrogenase [Legionella anisa]
MNSVFDVAIIGGGINGCGCAADAALRGLSVVLLEQDDLASKTSSSSTKLIHGGLRYLENYEFRMVKKAIIERQRLLDLAPHIVHPQAMVLPYEKHMRSVWFLRLGLFIYDHLSNKNRLPKCRIIYKKSKKNYFSALINKLNMGFLFYDAVTDDARLTIANAIQAKNHGASIRTHSTVIHAEVVNNLWQLTVQPKVGSSYTLYAKSVVNAAGPWVKSVEQLTQTPDRQKISLIKGSHIIVPQIYEGNHAYLLQHQDKRIIFVIPYHGFSMIGTTDIPLTGNNPGNTSISNEEIQYLIELVNLYFECKISEKDIIYTWSGVRSLLANGNKAASALSRDYSYKIHFNPAPIVTIYGGKITTYRQLAEEVINQLLQTFPQIGPSLTASTPLPGAVFEGMNFEQYTQYAKEKYKWMDKDLLQRYLYTYGSRMELFLAPCNSRESLGKKYCTYLYQVEVDYLILEEWAQSCDDILKRRTKLDIIIDEVGKKELAKYLSQAISHPFLEAPLLLH